MHNCIRKPLGIKTHKIFYAIFINESQQKYSYLMVYIIFSMRLTVVADTTVHTYILI